MDEHLLDGLERGDLILVRWRDASELRTGLGQHVERPEVYVKDIGVYLGIAGARNRYIVVGKDVVELWNEWGAARIPLDLVESVTRLMPRERVSQSIAEVQGLVRRVRVRRYRAWKP